MALKFSRARLGRPVSAVIESLPSPKKTLPELISFPWEMMESAPLPVLMVPLLVRPLAEPMPVIMSLSGVGELRYDEAQTRSPTTKMIFLILSRNRNISKSKNSELIIELNALTFVQMQE
jgi:hypothetical protein